MHLFRQIWVHLVKMKLSASILFALIIVTISTIVIYRLEPDTFEHPLHALWMVMTTSYTVGYGDVSPQTEWGQLFTMLFIFPIGIGAFGILVGKISQIVVYYGEKLEAGKVSFTGKNHYVFIGCKDKAEGAINEIRKVDKQARFVYIDEAEKSPFSHHDIHYISGNPALADTLLQANILQAKSVTIFADEQISPVFADGHNLLIASRIESLSKEYQTNIYTVVEILEEEHQPMFQHANVDRFVLSKCLITKETAKASLGH
jgi:voltage-gated potassium channel